MMPSYCHVEENVSSDARRRVDATADSMDK